MNAERKFDHFICTFVNIVRFGSTAICGWRVLSSQRAADAEEAAKQGNEMRKKA